MTPDDHFSPRIIALMVIFSCVPALLAARAVRALCETRRSRLRPISHRWSRRVRPPSSARPPLTRPAANTRNRGSAAALRPPRLASCGNAHPAARATGACQTRREGEANAAPTPRERERRREAASGQRERRGPRSSAGARRAMCEAGRDIPPASGQRRRRRPVCVLSLLTRPPHSPPGQAVWSGGRGADSPLDGGRRTLGTPGGRRPARPIQPAGPLHKFRCR